MEEGYLYFEIEKSEEKYYCWLKSIPT